MTLSTTITVVSKQEKLIDLPYYAKNSNETYSINADQSITAIYLTKNYFSLNTTTKECLNYARDLQRILAEEPATFEDYLEALELFRAKTETATTQPA